MKKCINKIAGLLLITVIIIVCCSYIPVNAISEGQSNRIAALKDEYGNIQSPPIDIVGWLPESAVSELLTYLRKEMPDRTIQYKYISKTNYSAVVDISLAEGAGADIVLEDYATTYIHAKQGYLVKQNELASKYEESGTKAFTYNGDIYAIPGLCQYAGIYYNKDIFKKYNIVVPKTYNEFLSICLMLKDEGVKPFSMGIYQWDVVQTHAMAYVVAEYLSTDEGAGFGKDYINNKVSLRNKWLPYMKEWAKLVEDEIITKDMLIEDNDYAVNEFAGGQTAMLCADTLSYRDIITKNPGLNFAMMPYGGNTTGEQILMGGAMYGFAINANSRNIDVAQKVLEAISTYKGQRAMWKTQIGSDTYLKGAQFYNPSEFDDIKSVIEADRVYAPWMNWGKASSAYIDFGMNLQEYIRGEYTLEKALSNTDLIVRALIKNN
ncbi:MAG: extracellular solute-binding protein [Butyrivibrio sp.]|nr:extracellular solute-binding protein [Butyrivibrio sp.]